MKELMVFLLAALPVAEVRASIPLGIAVYHLPPLTTIILSTLGGLLPVFPLLLFLTYIVKHLRAIPAFNNFIEWVFEHTRSKSKIIEDFELVGLALFIAIPLPGFGIWTGMAAAYLLGLRWLPTFLAALIGTIIACLLVWTATMGVLSFL